MQRDSSGCHQIWTELGSRKYDIRMFQMRNIPLILTLLHNFYYHSWRSNRQMLSSIACLCVMSFELVCVMDWFLAIAWWRHQMETFSGLLALCVGNSPVPVNSPHKGQWRGALMFSLIFARISSWVNNREAGDLRRHRGHYEVNVMDIIIADEFDLIGTFNFIVYYL